MTFWDPGFKFLFNKVVFNFVATNTIIGIKLWKLLFFFFSNRNFTKNARYTYF